MRSEMTSRHTRTLVTPAPASGYPALAEALAFEEGAITTAQFLLARETTEAQVSDASQDRDLGLEGRPPFHEAPVLPIIDNEAQERIYEREEMHTLDDEPETHVFAPKMLNISSQE